MLISFAELFQVRRHRKFFESFATTNGFDPLLPENWYLQSKANIMNSKVQNKKIKTENKNSNTNGEQGVNRVMCHYNNNISKALLSLFPDIGFDPSRLPFHQGLSVFLLLLLSFLFFFPPVLFTFIFVIG